MDAPNNGSDKQMNARHGQMTGFTDPAIESQQAFRSVMDALARPASVQMLATNVRAPAPLSDELATIALTLADNDVTLWLDAPLRASAEVAQFLRFHTGALLVDEPGDADFALVSTPESCPPLSAFRQGTAQFPEQSTTIVLQATSLTAAGGLRFRGPGVAADAEGDTADAEGLLGAQPLPENFSTQIALNRAQFPLGVDLIFVAPGAVSALPRSSAPMTSSGGAGAALHEEDT